MNLDTAKTSSCTNSRNDEVMKPVGSEQINYSYGLTKINKSKRASRIKKKYYCKKIHARHELCISIRMTCCCFQKYLNNKFFIEEKIRASDRESAHKIIKLVLVAKNLKQLILQKHTKYSSICLFFKLMQIKIIQYSHVIYTVFNFSTFSNI